MQRFFERTSKIKKTAHGQNDELRSQSEDAVF